MSRLIEKFLFILLPVAKGANRNHPYSLMMTRTAYSMMNFSRTSFKSQRKRKMQSLVHHLSVTLNRVSADPVFGTKCMRIQYCSC